MPFTLAHAAAALPLRRFGLVWSALVVGTMAPDFEYFAVLAPSDRYGHTLRGTLLLTLPLGLLVLWLFHRVVKAPLEELFPYEIRRRLGRAMDEFQFGPARRFGVIVISLLVGIATHLIWDSFTHPNTWLYRRWPLLREAYSLPVFGARPIYQMLQHGSTLLGVAILAVWVVRWYRSAAVDSVEADDSAQWWILVRITAIAFAGAMTRAFLGIGIPESQLGRTRFVGLWIVTLIALMWWQLVLIGIWRTRLARR